MVHSIGAKRNVLLNHNDALRDEYIHAITYLAFICQIKPTQFILVYGYEGLLFFNTAKKVHQFYVDRNL